LSGNEQEESVKQRTTIAIDLAKSVFEVGISERPGHLKQTSRLSREQLAEFIAKQPRATVIMEACGSSHYWGRKFQEYGHQVRLLPPLAVRPYVQRSKTDRTDVKGMLEASRNTAIKAVPVKTESQQQLTALHRVRAGWMSTRTKRINTLRGLLREFGIVFPTGAKALLGRVGETIEDADTPISMGIRDVLNELLKEIRELEERIESVEKQLKAIAAQTPVIERLRTIPGVGLLTATALVGFVGEAGRFPSGRHLASYLGLTPREHSSGSRRHMGRISKHGDTYLRTLLIHGGRSVVSAARRKKDHDRLRKWVIGVAERRGNNKAAVAAGNKLARIVWAVWTGGKRFAAQAEEATN
jgi:transposase